MGLYLCVFDGDDEVEGVEIGSYADFGVFRGAVRDRLEGGQVGSRFPVLMSHSDCDGAWTPADASALGKELTTIAEELLQLPPIAIEGGWKAEVVRTLRIRPTNLRDCFFDVDGEPLIDRLQGLCQVAVARQLPVLFQ